MAHKEGLDGSASCMKGRESTKNHWRSSKGGGVQRNAEKLVDSCKTRGRPFDGVGSWRQPVHVLVPRWGTREHQLYRDPDQVHVAKTSRENRYRSWGREYEHYDRADNRGSEMYYSVRQPRHNVEEGVLMGRENVTEICAVENVL